MRNWRKCAAISLIPALMCITSCAGATGVAGAASTAGSEAAEQAQQAAEASTETVPDGNVSATGEETPNEQSFDGKMHFEDGMAQPMLNYSSPDTPNAESEILRLCVYVETDYDTDGDGKADLVKAFVQVPRSAAEGKYKAAAIYDPTPYVAGIFEKSHGLRSYPYAEEGFDNSTLYLRGQKREAAEITSTMDAALKADPSEWIYTAPGTSYPGYYDTAAYDFYLVRGFAIVEACGIGTYGSEGFELCGSDLERDSHKCVVEWLTGDRAAFTDKDSNIEIKADWCNGSVAMTGCSYGGTLAYEVATTGVKGLKTVIPVAGISNWYDYRNSQGVTTYGQPNYTEYLASFNAGALFEDDYWIVPNEKYAAWITQKAKDEIAANGNFTGPWPETDYSDDYENISCSALIVHGLNDFNVLTKQSDLMYKAFRKAGQNVKVLWHQDGHNILRGKYVGDELYDDLLNKWLSHYLCDVGNGIEEMAEVTVQSNVDGTFRTFDSWGEAETLSVKPAAEGETEIQSGRFDDYYAKYMKTELPLESFYGDLDAEHAASYKLEVPAGATVYGVPEVHVKLKTPDVDQDNLMVSAVLLDTRADGKPFKAYITNRRLSNTLPVKTISTYEPGGGAPALSAKKYVQSPTDSKMFSQGWADLLDPGSGYISAENPVRTCSEADTYYDYTLYLTPTVYTVAEGHQLKLMIFAQDPSRSRLSDYLDDTPDFQDDKVDEVYSFTIDNASVEVKLPVRN